VSARPESVKKYINKNVLQQRNFYRLIKINLYSE